MSTDDSESPYDVGYCKPPVEHRFAKGKSGNPSGRLSKPVRSLTRRQLFTDPIKLGEKLVKVKRQGKTAMVPLIEVVWEGMATKAANGHGPSQRFFIKQYMLSIEQLHKHHSEFLRPIERFQADAANASQGEISPDDHEQLNYHRRRSHQLIGQYDSKKDPYVKKQARQRAAATARHYDRTSKGIRPAEAEALGSCPTTWCSSQLAIGDLRIGLGCNTQPTEITDDRRYDERSGPTGKERRRRFSARDDRLCRAAADGP